MRAIVCSTAARAARKSGPPRRIPRARRRPAQVWRDRLASPSGEPCRRSLQIFTAGKAALCRGNPVFLPGIDGNRRAESPRKSLEAGFCNVVVVGAIERLDMQGDARIHRKSLKKLAHEI